MINVKDCSLKFDDNGRFDLTVNLITSGTDNAPNINNMKMYLLNELLREYFDINTDDIKAAFPENFI